MKLKQPNLFSDDTMANVISYAYLFAIHYSEPTQYVLVVLFLTWEAFNNSK